MMQQGFQNNGFGGAQFPHMGGLSQQDMMMFNQQGGFGGFGGMEGMMGGNPGMIHQQQQQQQQQQSPLQQPQPQQQAGMPTGPRGKPPSPLACWFSD